jgi:hypothetical protein
LFYLKSIRLYILKDGAFKMEERIDEERVSLSS